MRLADLKPSISELSDLEAMLLIQNTRASREYQRTARLEAHKALPKSASRSTHKAAADMASSLTPEKQSELIDLLVSLYGSKAKNYYARYGVVEHTQPELEIVETENTEEPDQSPEDNDPDEESTEEVDDFNEDNAESNLL